MRGKTKKRLKSTATDMTTSHLTNPAEDAGQVIGYNPLTKFWTGPLTMLRTSMLHKLLVWPLLALSLSGYAADFSLEDIQGKTHRLADYRGKWVLVNFWATWCPPCLSEIPELSSLYNAHKDSDLVVIGIAMDSGSSRKVANFAEAHGISYPIVLGNRKIAAQIGKLEVLPTSYLYAPNGEQVSFQAGEVTRESVEAYIKNKKF
jgi:thiol-disulfide isomerase/thioredoxin